MKKAYNFRSKITHGSALSVKDFDELLDLSVACDDFLRRSFRKLFSIAGMDKVFSVETQLDEYFVELIFGLGKI